MISHYLFKPQFSTIVLKGLVSRFRYQQRANTVTPGSALEPPWLSCLVTHWDRGCRQRPNPSKRIGAPRSKHGYKLGHGGRHGYINERTLCQGKHRKVRLVFVSALLQSLQAHLAAKLHKTSTSKSFWSQERRSSVRHVHLPTYSDSVEPKEKRAFCSP